MVSLEKSGFLMFPHSIRGAIFIPAYAVSQEMIPKHSRILLSKYPVNAHRFEPVVQPGCHFKGTRGKVQLQKAWQIMTHVVNSHEGDATECRILA